MGSKVVVANHRQIRTWTYEALNSICLFNLDTLQYMVSTVCQFLFAIQANHAECHILFRYQDAASASKAIAWSGS